MTPDKVHRCIDEDYKTTRDSHELPEVARSHTCAFGDRKTHSPTPREDPYLCITVVRS